MKRQLKKMVIPSSQTRRDQTPEAVRGVTSEVGLPGGQAGIETD